MHDPHTIINRLKSKGWGAKPYGKDRGGVYAEERTSGGGTAFVWMDRTTGGLGYRYKPPKGTPGYGRYGQRYAKNFSKPVYLSPEQVVSMYENGRMSKE
jgi:hypothetical protein